MKAGPPEPAHADPVDWSVVVEASSGETRAHVAARDGELPPDFDQWDLRDAEGRAVAHIAAAYGNLPTEFSAWDLRDANGASVAHYAASEGHYRPVLEGSVGWAWDWVDHSGLTVAHEAALFGPMPPDFDQWDLADRSGCTVAEYSARNGWLVPEFDRWDLLAASPRRWRLPQPVLQKVSQWQASQPGAMTSSKSGTFGP